MTFEEIKALSDNELEALSRYMFPCYNITIDSSSNRGNALIYYKGLMEARSIEPHKMDMLYNMDANTVKTIINV